MGEIDWVVQIGGRPQACATYTYSSQSCTRQHGKAGEDRIGRSQSAAVGVIAAARHGRRGLLDRNPRGVEPTTTARGPSRDSLAAFDELKARDQGHRILGRSNRSRELRIGCGRIGSTGILRRSSNRFSSDIRHRFCTSNSVYDVGNAGDFEARKLDLFQLTYGEKRGAWPLEQGFCGLNVEVCLFDDEILLVAAGSQHRWPSLGKV